MDEDWRLTVTVREDAHAFRLLEALHGREVEQEIRARLGGRVAVSRGEGRLFLYAETYSAVREAERVARAVVAERALEADFAVTRWHPLEEQWEPADVPLPRSESEREAEHEQREEREAAESQASGVARWEVRIELASHGDAAALAERLRMEGFSVVRRWTYLIVGANSEDDATALAERIETEAPPGARVQVEPGGGLVWQTMPRAPFAIFGGLSS